MALFPSDRPPLSSEVDALQVRLSGLRLLRPRQWGACWLADQLWRTLRLDIFFGARLPITREGTDWEKVLRILVIYRLISPGSEWRLHRPWFETTALPDLLGVNERGAQDSGRPAAAKAGICCVPTWPATSRTRYGVTTCSWCLWKRRSARSKATSA